MKTREEEKTEFREQVEALKSDLRWFEGDWEIRDFFERVVSLLELVAHE